MVKTVIFDIDGTLYNFTEADRAAKQALLDYVSREFGIGEEEYRRLDKGQIQETIGRCGHIAVIHNRLVRIQNILEKQGLPVIPHAARMTELYWNVLLDHMEPEPGVEAVFRALKARGIRIGIGSNMTAYIQHRKLERLGLGPYIDFIVTSEEAAAEKPEPAFFEYCLKKAGCGASECLFIGDNPRLDVEAAQAVGMRAVLYGNGGISYTECLREGRLAIGGEVIGAGAAG